MSLGDDPFTSDNELHCNGKNQLSDSYPETGHVGNLCQIDCSNRGICNYDTGTCSCFKGSYGDNCAITSRTGIYKNAASAPAADYLPPFSSDNSSSTQQIELGVDDNVQISDPNIQNLGSGTKNRKLEEERDAFY